MGITRIIGMDEDRLVGEHRFWPGRSDDQRIACFLDFVFEIVHIAHDFFMFDFDIG